VSNVQRTLFHLNHLDFLNEFIYHLSQVFFVCSREDDSNNETVESKGFSENEDEDHAYVYVFLSVGTYTGITDNSDSESSSECGETTAESSSQVLEAGVVVVLDVTDLSGGDDLALVDNCDDKAVDTENTSHDTGDQRLEYEIGSQHSNAANTDTRLGSSIGGSEVSKNEGRCKTHVPEEGVLVDLIELLKF